MAVGPILLAPREEEKEVYPYRRVWRTASIEILILLAMMVVTLVAVRILHVSLGSAERRIFGVAFAIAPLLLWVAISYQAEGRAAQPRQYMFTVVILSMLVANGVGVPLIERVFAVEEWLSTAVGSQRILGYMFTVGIIQEFSKYAVVRYGVWPRAIRIRTDGIAYTIAAGVGYATVLNLNYVLSADVSPLSVALRVVEFTLTQVAISTIMGYFLSELKLAAPSIVALPLGLLLAAVLNALSITFRGGLIVGGVSPTSTANNAIQGIGVAIFLWLFLFSAFSFLINNADERELLRNRPEFQR